MEYTDEEILKGILSRDPDVYDYLDYKFKGGIKLLIYEMGGSSEDGEDMFGEGLVGLIEMTTKPDFELTCKLSTLFFSICKKQWQRVLDKKTAAKNYKTRHNEQTETEDFSEDMDYVVYKRVFSECFDKLGKECRQILNGYFKEIPLMELAEILDYTYHTLRKKKSICHAALMKIINEHPDYKSIIKEQELDITF